jgi:hypothetical protein
MFLESTAGNIIGSRGSPPYLLRNHGDICGLEARLKEFRHLSSGYDLEEWRHELFQERRYESTENSQPQKLVINIMLRIAGKTGYPVRSSIVTRNTGLFKSGCK